MARTTLPYDSTEPGPETNSDPGAQVGHPDMESGKTLASNKQPVMHPDGVDAMGKTLASAETPPQQTPGGSTVLFEKLPTAPPDKYIHRHEIGRGGIGRVDLSYDTHLGRPVAIKELLPHLVSLGSTPRSGSKSTLPSHSEVRFLNEARITGYLEHPGIVPVYEVGQSEAGTLYYAMKFVEGETFSSRLRVRNLIERLALLPIFLDVCNAIAYAHSKGVIHRDLKPENIMLGKFGETIVLDWGLAKKNDNEDLVRGELAKELVKLKSEMELSTASGVPVGTPQYMPPEQARGEIDAIDERSDVYTLGAILYEVLTGSPPFQGKSPLSVILAVVSETVEHPLVVDPQIPRELASIAMKALSKDRRDRYDSALDLAEEIRRWQRGELVRAYTYTRGHILFKWMQRHKRSLLAVGVLVMVLTAALVAGSAMESRKRARDERAREAAAVARVKELVERAGEPGAKGANWFDIYTFKLISLKEPVVEAYLLTQLNHPDLGVRKMVIRALGGMKSHRAVMPLVARLEAKAESSVEMVIESIKALGIIGDARANSTVQKIRWEAGQFSYLWDKTEVAYSMIPVPKVARLSALDFEALHLRGKALYNKGKRNEAVTVFKEAITKKPSDFRPYNMLGIALKAMGRHGEAIEWLSRASAVSSDGNHYILNNRGLIYKKIEQYDRALKDFNAAIALKPKWASGYNNRASVHLLMGNYVRGEADYLTAIRLRPRSRRYHTNLGSLYLDMGDSKKAMEQLYKALELAPDNVVANRYALYVKLYEKRYDEAQQLLTKLQELRPQDVLIHYAALVVYTLTGDATALGREIHNLRLLRADSRYYLKYLSAAYFAQKKYSQGINASRASFKRKGNNTKERQYILLRRLPHLIIGGKFEEFSRLMSPLVDRNAMQWVDVMARYVLGEITTDAFKEAVISKYRLTEYHLYTGLIALKEGRRTEALASFREAEGLRFYDQVEWFYALQLVRQLAP